MSELVADCKRCGSQRITFDLLHESPIGNRHGIAWYETFCVCRHCGRSTIFVLSQRTDVDRSIVAKAPLEKLPVAVNRLMKIEGSVSVKDDAVTDVPEHLPPDIDSVFREGARCQAVECFNAAATMYRLCVDLGTRSLLPEGDVVGLNAKTRRDLGLRLPWLFANERLPKSLEDISSCIKEDGNDGAHAGTLGRDDAEDLLDFTTSLLERLYTEPKKLHLAKERRIERRSSH